MAPSKDPTFRDQRPDQRFRVTALYEVYEVWKFWPAIGTSRFAPSLFASWPGSRTRLFKLHRVVNADQHIQLLPRPVSPLYSTCEPGMECARISSISWGQIAIDSNSISKAKDCKLYPGGGREWDWRETGTRHQPGVQQGDVEECVKAGAVEIVLSRGMDLKLGVPDDTVRWLENQGIKVHVAETRQAVEIYNRLVGDGVKVGGCFHSTC